MNETYLALIQFASALSIALKERDAYTRLHSDRVMNLSTEIGAHLGLPSNDLMLLKTAAALHDVGKIGIPDEVLLKEGSLDNDELSIMHRHSERGENIVLSLKQDGSDIVAEAIRHHHEFFNGQGYPDRLAGESIPIFSRIISIADNYDAMATRRVYQDAKCHTAVMDIMSDELGHKHDPVIFAAFTKLIEKSEFRVR
ncbi:cyclic di-GMP phosphodiesterase response regulator RpfG [mine drainage metagenome]|uniref:Cyclic di-GMP phosphodiesterase response regulator RpfG n=1 Tax=mine drainage metagenome TaxID=410659 RepID=A0A1J5TAH6_9ZZZZ